MCVEWSLCNPVHLNVFLKARHERETLNIPWTYRKQESVFKVGEFSVTLFTAVPAVVLVQDLLVTVYRRTCPVQASVLPRVQ